MRRVCCLRQHPPCRQPTLRASSSQLSFSDVSAHLSGVHLNAILSRPLMLSLPDWNVFPLHGLPLAGTQLQKKKKKSVCGEGGRSRPAQSKNRHQTLSSPSSCYIILSVYRLTRDVRTCCNSVMEQADMTCSCYARHATAHATRLPASETLAALQRRRHQRPAPLECAQGGCGGPL